ncbi:MAG: radical SAM protein [Patescibacteria group bacterium]|nr:radical SAM protein [Patescibacteria group bacterium]
MQTIDVLLVLLPMYQSGRTPDYNPKEPMGLMYLAASLRTAGFSVEILDADVLALTIDETLSRITKCGAKVIGFSVLQRALPSVKLLVEGLRKNGITAHICCGGITATMSAEHILQRIPGIDSIVLGEGDLSFRDLVAKVIGNSDWHNLLGVAFRNSSVVTNGPSPKPDLDSLAHASRDLLTFCLLKTNYATILASRGCYGVCTFCSNCSFERISTGPNWRPRNPVDVVDEIEQLRRECGVTVFKFNDANLFGPGRDGRRHVVTLCDEILRRNLNDLHLMGFCRSNDVDDEIANLMRRAGFERLLVGIESFDPSTLRIFRKGESQATILQMIRVLHKAEIGLIPGFMIFNPYTAISSLIRDLDFLERFGFMPTLSKALRVFDGTPIQALLSSEGRLIWRSPLEGYHEYLIDPRLAAIYMALKTVSVEWIDLVKKTYQDELWGIKKAPTFNQRKSFDTLSRLVFDIELQTLRALIDWTEHGYSLGDIRSLVAKLKQRLWAVETFILTESNLSEPRLNVGSFSETEMASRIHSILQTKVFRTFPEQYRWRDD